MKTLVKFNREQKQLRKRFAKEIYTEYRKKVTELEQLTAQLNEAGFEFVGFTSTSKPVKVKASKGVGRPRGKMPLGEAVLKALENSKECPKSDLKAKVATLVGREVNESSYTATLVDLVKAKKIANPSRGVYQKKQ